MLGSGLAVIWYILKQYENENVNRRRDSGSALGYCIYNTIEKSTGLSVARSLDCFTLFRYRKWKKYMWFKFKNNLQGLLCIRRLGSTRTFCYSFILVQKYNRHYNMVVLYTSFLIGNYFIKYKITLLWYILYRSDQ